MSKKGHSAKSFDLQKQKLDFGKMLAPPFLKFWIR